jgi:excinuclease ABC subunit A
MQSTKILTLRGVRTHNLKNIDVDIPLGKLTVITGVSGAGKSSLVFDTLYAESQRRYLQSFSTHTRQFLERFDKPDAEQIGDLPPAVAIRRSSMRPSPRSTVGALSEIDALLRLLFARAGTLECPDCGQRVIAQRTGDVLAALQAMPPGTLCTIAFAASPLEATDQPAWLAALLEEGYLRIQVGRTIYRLGAHAVPALAPKDKIWVLLDRIEIGKTPIERLSESVEAAFRRGPGRIGILTETNEHVFDQRFVCARCERVFRAPEPRLFDANDPLGACPACKGAGVTSKSAHACSACQGRRWNADALAVHLGDRTIADWHALSLIDLLAFVPTLQFPEDQRAGILLDQIRDRLQSLVALDVGYVTLRQPAASLSDGAARRIALTAALASNLVHVLYLIDEPTTGLHPRDTGKLLDALRRLRERGNTVVVIEHDRQVIASVDHVIDLGPAPGRKAGKSLTRGHWRDYPQPRKTRRAISGRAAALPRFPSDAASRRVFSS